MEISFCSLPCGKSLRPLGEGGAKRRMRGVPCKKLPSCAFIRRMDLYSVAAGMLAPAAQMCYS